ncbi:VLRF1 family aeRF1-type release factor [Bacillus atrophaeus]|uniref:VLRF1 family aeRF1-type release factor n=1 Tax=Bacillus atrophaeus TaxID=1452 RepID=UPI001239388B|nr:VLRF1 family aeRF1-type release factor [Bacillus atrophaeus]KAA6450212.1 hypothetical protein DX926_12155 [Bacillus atrophaeus]
MSFNTLIKKLKHVQLESPDKMLSLYVNTDVRDPEQQGGEWKIVLKTGFSRLKEYLAASDPEEEKCLDALIKKIYQYIDGKGKDMPRSFVFFASHHSRIWEVIELKMPVETRFYWEESAVLDQLEALHEEYPSTAFVLTQQNEVKIIETVLGEIEAIEHYEYDLVNETWEPHEAKHESPPSSMDQEDVKDHIKDNQKRLYKRLASRLDEKAAAKKWERLIIAGDKETADILDRHMNKPIHTKIQKNLLNENEHKVIEDLLQEA